MGPFLLFCYPTYYPGGAEGDFIGRYDDHESLSRAVIECKSKSVCEHFDCYDIGADTWIDVGQ